VPHHALATPDERLSNWRTHLPLLHIHHFTRRRIIREESSPVKDERRQRRRPSSQEVKLIGYGITLNLNDADARGRSGMNQFMGLRPLATVLYSRRRGCLEVIRP